MSRKSYKPIVYFDKPEKLTAAFTLSILDRPLAAAEKMTSAFRGGRVFQFSPDCGTIPSDTTNEKQCGGITSRVSQRSRDACGCNNHQSAPRNLAFRREPSPSRGIRRTRRRGRDWKQDSAYPLHRPFSS